MLPPASTEPRAELDAVLAPLVERGGCFVSFSGGQDSSAVLAAAVACAREHGLALPVPITLRFPGRKDADEAAWQESVVQRLGLDDWVRIDIRDELDFLGGIGTDVLQRNGLLWPANVMFHVPVFQCASGGTLLTGLDGDGLFGGWRWHRAQRIMHGRVRPRPRDMLHVGLALSPVAVRVAVLRTRPSVAPSWLRPEARGAVVGAFAREDAEEPSRWDRRVEWFAGRRYLELAIDSLATVGADYAVEVVHPLIAPPFLAALAARRGRMGYRDRREAMRDLVGDLLPDAVLERRTKAEFGAAMWGPASRAFAEEWDGRSGVDPGLVEPDVLRAAWRSEHPPLSSATLLQCAWIAQRIEN